MSPFKDQQGMLLSTRRSPDQPAGLAMKNNGAPSPAESHEEDCETVTSARHTCRKPGPLDRSPDVPDLSPAALAAAIQQIRARSTQLSRSAAARIAKRKKPHKHLECRIAGCKSSDDFRGAYELERHVKTFHDEDPRVGDKARYKCRFYGCSQSKKVFLRRDKFRLHLKRHGCKEHLNSLIFASRIVESIEAGHDDTVSECPPPVDSVFSTPPPATDDSARAHPRPVADSEPLHADQADSSDRSRSHLSNCYQGPDVGGLVANRSVSVHARPIPTLLSHRVGACQRSASVTDPALTGYPDPLKEHTSAKEAGPILKAAHPHDAGDQDPGNHQQSSFLGLPGLSFGGGIPFGQRGGKRKRGQPDNEPPDEGNAGGFSGPGVILVHGVFYFYCAFHFNPDCCQFEPHRRERFQFVSKLKRFHERHGLFCCGRCWTRFPSKQERRDHDQRGCQAFRCLTPGCNLGELVDPAAACQRLHHGKNSQWDTYQYLRRLASDVLREQQVLQTGPQLTGHSATSLLSTSSSVTGSTSFVGSPLSTPHRTLRPATSQQPTLLSASSYSANDTLPSLIRHLWLIVNNPQQQLTPRRDQQFYSYMANVDDRRADPSLLAPISDGEEEDIALLEQLHAHCDHVSDSSLRALDGLFQAFENRQRAVNFAEAAAPGPSSTGTSEWANYFEGLDLSGGHAAASMASAETDFVIPSAELLGSLGGAAQFQNAPNYPASTETVNNHVDRAMFLGNARPGQEPSEAADTIDYGTPSSGHSTVVAETNPLQGVFLPQMQNVASGENDFSRMAKRQRESNSFLPPDE